MNPIFITGVVRSGTTLLGQLVGTLNNIEYEFELLALIQIPVLVRYGFLRKDIAVQLLSSAIHERLVERVLGRKVNLRPTDWSRFWLMKSYEDLVTRWSRDSARQDVQCIINEQHLRFAGKSPNLILFHPFLLETFPNSQIITITRYCFDVVASILKKDWTSNRGLRQWRAVIPKREVPDGRIIPWWVPVEMEKKFLGWNAATRALYQWRFLTEEEESQESSDRVLKVHYEALVGSPYAVLTQILDFLRNSDPTMKTGEILLSIDPTRARNAKLDRSLFDEEELFLAEQLMKRRGEL